MTDVQTSEIEKLRFNDRNCISFLYKFVFGRQIMKWLCSSLIKNEFENLWVVDTGQFWTLINNSFSIDYDHYWSSSSKIYYSIYVSSLHIEEKKSKIFCLTNTNFKGFSNKKHYYLKEFFVCECVKKKKLSSSFMFARNIDRLTVKCYFTVGNWQGPILM